MSFMTLKSFMSHSSFVHAELPLRTFDGEQHGSALRAPWGDLGFCGPDSNGWNWLEFIGSTGSIVSIDPIDSIASIDSSIYAFGYINTNININIYIYIHVLFMIIYMRTYIYIYMHVYIYLCI